MDPTTRRSRARALARAFLARLGELTLDDVPLARITLAAQASPSSSDALSRALAEVAPAGPRLLASLEPEERAALEALGDLVEQQDALDDETLLARLRALGPLLRAAISAR